MHSKYFYVILIFVSQAVAMEQNNPQYFATIAEDSLLKSSFLTSMRFEDRVAEIGMLASDSTIRYALQLLYQRAQFDRQGALLTCIKLQETRLLLCSQIGDIEFGLLWLLKDLDIEMFRKFCHDIKYEHLGLLVDGFFKYPYYIEQFKNTNLDFDHVLSFGLTALTTNNKIAHLSFFLAVIVDNIEKLPLNHKKELLRILSIILYKDDNSFCSSACETMSKLLQSPEPAVRVVAFKALKAYITTTKNRFERKRSLRELLSKDLMLVADAFKRKPDVLYKQLYKRFKDSGDHRSMEQIRNMITHVQFN